MQVLEGKRWAFIEAGVGMEGRAIVLMVITKSVGEDQPRDYKADMR